jgi:hypothetical protein
MKFIPKVGEECLYSLGDSYTWHKCNIIFIVGTQGVVIESKQVFEGVQFCSFYGNEAVKFKPIKTPAEIERDVLKSELDKDSYIHLMKVIALGYRKQQVKPLMTRSEFILICESERWANDIYEKVKGCTIQGGDK